VQHWNCSEESEDLAQKYNDGTISLLEHYQENMKSSACITDGESLQPYVAVIKSNETPVLEAALILGYILPHLFNFNSIFNLIDLITDND